MLIYRNRLSPRKAPSKGMCYDWHVYRTEPEQAAQARTQDHRDHERQPAFLTQVQEGSAGPGRDRGSAHER